MRNAALALASLALLAGVTAPAAASTTGLSAQTITPTTTPATSYSIGATYIPAASATSGLPVAITVDPSSSAVCSISSGVVSFTAAGTCVLDFNQPGDGVSWSAAPQVTQTIIVTTASSGTGGPTPQSVTFTSTDTGALHPGDTYTPTATASSGLAVTITIDPVSTGTCSISNGVVTFISTGACVIDASQPGDAAWASAPQVQQTLTVSPGTINGGVEQTGLLALGPSMQTVPVTHRANSVAVGSSQIGVNVLITTPSASLVRGAIALETGGVVHLSGFGFPSGSTVAISIGGSLADTVAAGANGTYQAVFTVNPHLTDGPYAAVFSSGTGGGSADILVPVEVVSRHVYESASIVIPHWAFNDHPTRLTTLTATQRASLRKVAASILSGFVSHVSVVCIVYGKGPWPELHAVSHRYADVVVALLRADLAQRGEQLPVISTVVVRSETVTPIPRIGLGLIDD